MQSKAKSAIKVENITVAYADKPVLWNLSCHFNKGKITAIVGPNGAGKSTLLKILLGLIKPVSGQYSFPDYEGMSKKIVKSHLAYVPQSSSVDWDFPTTVHDVVLMGTYGKLGWLKRPGKKEKELARLALEKVGMNTYADRQIGQLSGGQQQRVFLARALAQEADIYLMDEPFKGVDKISEKAIVSILKELKEQGKSVIIVHHDLQTVKEYFDDVALLNIHLIAAGFVEEVFTETNIQKTYRGLSLADGED